MKQSFEPHPVFDDSTSELDLGALGSAIGRKKRWIFLTTLVAFIGIGFFVTVTKPMYTAESQVLLENQDSFLPRSPQVQAAPEANFDEQFVGSQIQLLTSRDIARGVIANLGLVGNPDFDPAAKGLGAISQLLILFGLEHNPTGVTPEDRVADTFSRRLTVFSPLKTRVITVQFQAHDPVMAARITNAIVALYLKTQADAKREQAKTAAIALSAHIADLRSKLTTAADAVERYRNDSGLLAGSNNMTVGGQQLADLNTEISKARTEEADARAKAALIRDMVRSGRLSDVADVANNDLVRRVAEQSVTAKAELALESRTLLPEHPRIKELTAQIAGLDAQLRAAAANTARTLETNARVAASRLANLETALDQQKNSVARSNVDQVHLHELERTAQALRDQLDGSMAKYQEALAQETSPETLADARIITRAVPPDQPSFPKKLPMLLFGTIAALVLSTAAVIGSELLAGSGSPRRELPGTRKPVPAASPVQNNQKERRFGPPSEPAAGATLGGLRDYHDREPPPSGWQEAGARIVATCVVSSDGAAATLLDFARGLVHEGRPILIDLDAESDDLAHRLTAEDGPARRSGAKRLGLTDLVSGDASYADVIHRDAASRLHFILYGSGGALRAADLDVIFDALSQTYDFVILAAPALAVNEMAKSLAGLADFVVLIGTGATKERCSEAYGDLVEAGAPEVTLIGKAGRMRGFKAA